MIAKDYIQEKVRKARKGLQQMETVLERCPYELDTRNISSLKDYLKYVDQNLDIIRGKLNEETQKPC